MDSRIPIGITTDKNSEILFSTEDFQQMKENIVFGTYRIITGFQEEFSKSFDEVFPIRLIPNNDICHSTTKILLDRYDRTFNFTTRSSLALLECLQELIYPCMSKDNYKEVIGHFTRIKSLILTKTNTISVYKYPYKLMRKVLSLKYNDLDKGSYDSSDYGDFKYNSSNYGNYKYEGFNIFFRTGGNSYTSAYELLICSSNNDLYVNKMLSASCHIWNNSSIKENKKWLYTVNRFLRKFIREIENNMEVGLSKSCKYSQDIIDYVNNPNSQYLIFKRLASYANNFSNQKIKNQYIIETFKEITSIIKNEINKLIIATNKGSKTKNHNTSNILWHKFYSSLPGNFISNFIVYTMLFVTINSYPRIRMNSLDEELPEYFDNTLAVLAKDTRNVYKKAVFLTKEQFNRSDVKWLYCYNADIQDYRTTDFNIEVSPRNGLNISINESIEDKEMLYKYALYGHNDVLQLINEPLYVNKYKELYPVNGIKFKERFYLLFADILSIRGQLGVVDYVYGNRLRRYTLHGYDIKNELKVIKDMNCSEQIDLYNKTVDADIPKGKDNIFYNFIFKETINTYKELGIKNYLILQRLLNAAEIRLFDYYYCDFNFNNSRSECNDDLNDDVIKNKINISHLPKENQNLQLFGILCETLYRCMNNSIEKEIRDNLGNIFDIIGLNEDMLNKLYYFSGYKSTTGK